MMCFLCYVMFQFMPLTTEISLHFYQDSIHTAQRTRLLLLQRLIGKCCKGRAMAQAVSRRPLTAEARVRSWVSPYENCGGRRGNGTGTSVFPCQFHSTGAPLLGKMKKTDHLYHRVAQ
jgi:hypothetical protein